MRSCYTVVSFLDLSKQVTFTFDTDEVSSLQSWIVKADVALDTPLSSMLNVNLVIRVTENTD
jgi:hypothetical protein